MYRQSANTLAKKQCKRNTAFTLAEVLITLAIIGVVAALTIPSLLASTTKHQYVSGLKEAIRTLTEATERVKEANGGTLVGAFGTNYNYSMVDAYRPYLSILKQCPVGGCSNPSGLVWKTLYGDDNVWFDMFDGGDITLSNGMIFHFTLDDTTCSTYAWNYCGNAIVDVNGIKSPNQMGRDTFRILVNRNGVWPDGTEDSNYGYIHGASCNPADNNIYSGIGCGARIMLEGDMNY